jgi:oxygen-independent coproporphyrinogen-3 oxidase
LKYWTRQPYLGFGVDAHSMLYPCSGEGAVRFSNPDVVEKYASGNENSKVAVDIAAALEETIFLGLRLNRGVDLESIAETFGRSAVENLADSIAQLVRDDLLEGGRTIRLTSRGRLLSNEVFERFIPDRVFGS